MFENAILVASLIPDKKIREEKLPKLVFDEYDFGAWREETRHTSHMPRLFGRRRAANSGR